MRIFTITFLCSLSFLSAFSQQKISLESIIPPAPNAAEMAKYGSYPVGMLTGLPDISIPLYEINTGKLKLPITASYHASGIKVNQKSTDVGLGWSINAGGSISRSVFGSADDLPNGYFNYTIPTLQYLNDIDIFETLQLYTFNPGYDLEPDLFVYNMAGRSGKFICRANKQFLTIPFDPIKIEKSLNGQNKVVFTLRDDNGTIYEFRDYSIGISEAQNNTPITRQSISTWMLTRMISADYKDTISFEYENIAVQDAIEQNIYPIGSRVEPNANSPSHVNGPLQQSWTSVNYGELLLKKIIFNNGTITFNRNTLRKDVLLQSRSLDEIIITNSNNLVIKKILLNHSYFQATPFVDAFDHYRLQLTEIVETDNNNTAPRKHKFTYDPTPLPRYWSYSIDYWGFYNGQNNQSLIPTNTVYGTDLNYVAFNDGKTYTNGYDPTTYWAIGNANREPSEEHMKACILKKIDYPTGGYTEFEYEPHKYQSASYVQQPVSKGGNIIGINATTKNEVTYNFQYPSVSGTPNYGTVLADFYIQFSASSMANSIIDDPQTVTLTDITASTVLTRKHDGDITVPQTLNLKYNLVPGHSYQLKATIYGPPSTFINCSLAWNENTSTPLLKIGGGLRIKSVKSFGMDNILAKEENYVYGTGGSGVGTRLFDEQKFYKNYEDNVLAHFKAINELSGTCALLPGGTTWIRNYMGISTYSTVNYMGTAVLYPQVTKYEGTSTNNIGKTVYNFQIAPSTTFIPAEFVNSGNYGNIDHAWRQGELLDETLYKKTTTGYDTVLKTIYEYGEYGITQEPAIQIKQYKHVVKLDDCNIPDMAAYTENGRPGLAHFSLFQYQIKTGATRKTKETKIVYDQNDPLKSATTISAYQYQNAGHLYATEVSTTQSDGSRRLSRLKYPQDVAQTMPLAMVSKNILSPILEEKSYKSIGGSETLLATTQTEYKQINDLVVRDRIKASRGNQTAEDRIVFNQYDIFGKITEQRKTDDAPMSYIWDYKNSYPIAEIINASVAEVAYTSFEADGTGGWNIPSNLRASVGLTGSRAYLLSNGAVTRSSLRTQIEYTISYWSTNGTYTVSGNTGTPKQGKTITVNGTNWTYFEHRVTGIASIQISGSGNIDELRLHPSNAQMNTYTFEPLVGITSQCDKSGSVAFYEYDVLGRLKSIRDQDRNVLKSFDYKYQEQQ